MGVWSIHRWLGLVNRRVALWLFLAAAVCVTTALVYFGFHTPSMLCVALTPLPVALLVTVGVPHLRNFGLTTVSLVVAVLSCEGLLALREADVDIDDIYPPDCDYRSGGYLTQHPVYGLHAKPGTFTSTRMAPDGSVVYDVTYTIGEDGFRVTPMSLSDKPGRSVYFVGGSFTFGEGLDDHETLAGLWHRLNPLDRTKNYGFHGWGVHQALAVIRRETLVRGGLVVLQTSPWHAARASCSFDFTYGSPRFEIVDGALRQRGQCRVVTGNPDIDVGMLDQSRLYKKMSDAWFSTHPDRHYDLYVSIVREIARLCATRGLRLIVAFIEAERAQFAGSHYSNDILKDQMIDAGIPLVDVSLPPTHNFIIRGDGHPTAEANRRRVRMLMQHDPAVQPEAATTTMRLNAGP